MDLHTRQLRAFLAVADLGSFSKAAARLHMAQPALSQAVRDLEGKLALRLFDRTTRRVELTEGGIEFRRAANKILDDLATATREAAERARGARGRIVIAAPPLLAAAILPQAIAAFAREHPAVRIVVLDVATAPIVEAVRSGRADCGIGTFPPAFDDIARTRLARDELMAFFAKDDAPRRRKLTWSDLRGQSLITLTRDSGIRLLVEIGFEAARMPLVPAHEVAQITTAIALVEAGLGIAVLPAYARAVTTSRAVVERPLVGPVIARDIDLIHGQGRSLSPALVAFQAVLAQRLRQLGALR